jgi:hypothetical protein
MRLIDAYDRGYITTAEYTYYLDHGYTNDTPINVDLEVYKDSFYGATIRLIKRDPNLRIELTFELNGTGLNGILQDNDVETVYIPFEGRICGYSLFLDTSSTSVFDVFTNTTFPVGEGTSITGNAPPSITTGTYEVAGEAGVAAWVQHIAASKYIGFQCTANNNAHRAVFTLVIEPATQLLALI